MPKDEAELRLKDLGEFELIERLKALLEARSRAPTPDAASPGAASLGEQSLLAQDQLELGIGDDAAVWRPRDGARQVVTTDALIENVHFKLSSTSWRDLGWKALAVNVSDVAAMGARPCYTLLTLGVQADTRLDDVLELYDGISDLAACFQVVIAGGDVVSSPLLFLGVTLVGEAVGEVLRRDAGRPGDLLAVTGTLGGSAGGLRVLEGRSSGAALHPEAAGRLHAGRAEGASQDDVLESLVSAHLRPRPRVAEGSVLVSAGLRCAIDISDGLLGDVAHICERSGASAVIESACVPVHPGLQARFGDEALMLALAGGEDYELLCAGEPAAMERARNALTELGTPLNIVGRLIERTSNSPLVQLLDAAGEPLEPTSGSWEHFRA